MLTERQLRERVEELEEEVRQLREQLHGRLPTTERVVQVRDMLGVLRGEVYVMLTLLERSPRVVTKEQLLSTYAHYSQLVGGGRDVIDLDHRQMTVRVHRLRKALRPHDVDIRTVWGIGYLLSVEGAAKFRALMGWVDA